MNEDLEAIVRPYINPAIISLPGSVERLIIFAILTRMREPTPEVIRQAESAGISFATLMRVWPTVIDAIAEQGR